MEYLRHFGFLVLATITLLSSFGNPVDDEERNIKYVNLIEIIDDNGNKITGDYNNYNFKNAIEIISWDQAIYVDHTYYDENALKAYSKQISFSKEVDASTLYFMSKCKAGEKVKQINIQCYEIDKKNQAKLYLTIQVESALIINMSLGGSGYQPYETIGLRSDKDITYIYKKE